MNVRFLSVFLVLFFIVVMVTMGPDFSNLQLINQQICVGQPDPLHSVIYNNAEYRRIRIDAPIFFAEVPIHFQPTVPSSLLVEGKNRPSYVPWFDGILDPKYVNWRPLAGVDLLLFIDKTELGERPPDGFHNFDVYIKPLQNGQYVLPKFIESFCSSNYPIVKKALKPDATGNFSPPISFDVSQLTNWQRGDPDKDGRPPTDRGPYYLLSYDTEGTPTWSLTLLDWWPRAKLSIGNKRYTAIYVPWSSIRYVMLIDEDSANANPKTGYRYTFADGEFQPTLNYIALTPGPSRPNLQLETFFYPNINAWGWWNPECKPAIYLYPERKTDVHVKVSPAGFLTYTDPQYPINGWQVTAFPDGKIISANKTYPYLYYEAKINDNAVEKPETGYVVPYADLPNLFSTILPKLGLLEHETKDFKDYWEKILPNSPYYFIGLMKNEAIEKIEPLTIYPKEDTIIRVRLYFEALSESKKVKEPIFIKPERKGFTVVEWGGLVKNDPNHPFTCSQ